MWPGSRLLIQDFKSGHLCPKKVYSDSSQSQFGNLIYFIDLESVEKHCMTGLLVVSCSILTITKVYEKLAPNRTRFRIDNVKP